MNQHFHVLDNDGKVIVDNLLEECKNCYSKCNSNGNLISVCPKYGDSRRQGIIRTSRSVSFLCCKTTKTTKLFKEKLEALAYVYPELAGIRNEIAETIRREEQRKVNRLVHNLTSINAHNIQEIYDLISQQTLTSHWKNQVEFIEKAIKKDSAKAAMTFLRISKHNIHMKSEFSIYRKLDRGDTVAIDLAEHSIRNVILNVLHTFFSDFTNKNIHVNVEEYTGKLQFDYETIQVAIYHLIDNVVKYSKPKSEINIRFIETALTLDVVFEMISIYNKPEERNLIYNEGYSGVNAVLMEKHGDGIGMWRIKQMMELNSGSCVAYFGDTIEKVMGFDFAKNAFVLKFKKNINETENLRQGRKRTRL